MTVFLLSVVIALSISALCSLLEAALLSLTPSQVAELSQNRPKAGHLWQRFKERIEQPIAVILILNTAAHTIGATIAGAKFEELFGDSGLIWFSLIFTYLMLQFTEILPKSLGVRFNRILAPWMAYPLWILIRLFSPILWCIHLVNQLFERKRTSSTHPSTLEEIAALAGLARISNMIGPHQERIIMGASRLSEKTAGNVMIPVDHVALLSTSQSLTDAILTAHLEPHTRFPVCEEGDRNRILGYVNFKELIYRARTNPTDPSLRGIVRPVRFIAPDDPAPQLLRAFVDQHEHMAIVRSADHRTLGLITLEDLIEELVGELEDEFDRLPRMIHPLGTRTWMFGGGVPMREVLQQIGKELPDSHGTISAWLTEKLGDHARVNQSYSTHEIRFSVRRMRRGKIFEVLVTVESDRNELQSMDASTKISEH